MLSLSSPLKVGRMDLSGRVFLPPLTRLRAGLETGAPDEKIAKYYGDRAHPGALLITEAINISPETYGLVASPGLWTAEQVAGWKRATDAVHAKGGYIYAQLWHVGRLAHPSFNEHPLVKGSDYTTNRSASDVSYAEGPGYLYPSGYGENEPPVPLSLEEIDRVRRDYTTAAKNALEAGFDGVELHAAHGYLIDQFLNSKTNKRTDRYGGSVENRTRLLTEVLDDLITVAGSDRVALRLSPHTNGKDAIQGMEDEDPATLYTAAVTIAAQRGLAYLLLTEPRTKLTSPSFEEDFKLNSAPVTVGVKYAPLYRTVAAAAATAAAAGEEGEQKASSSSSSTSSPHQRRAGPVVFGAGGFTPFSGAVAVAEGVYDGVGIGRWWIANPDLLHRIQNGLPLNKYNRDLFYAPGQHAGYNDYPTFAELCAQLGEDPAAFAPLPEEAGEAEVAAREARIDALVAKAEEKGVGVGLMSIRAIGNATSMTAQDNKE